MRKCRKCQSPVPEGKFVCPVCQTPYIEETVVCPECGTENDMDAPACSQCGQKLFAGEPQTHISAHDIFDTSHMRGLEQEVADRFSLAFEKRMKEEHHPSLHGSYIDRFFKSEFRTSADYRIQQLAEQVGSLTGDKKNLKKEKNAILHPAFEELIDYFVIRYCSDLNETNFPEAILKYQGLSRSQIDTGQMILDYLGFQDEPDTVYFDFVTMPTSRLKNAADHFLAPKKGETLYFICDLSLLGNCKDGFAMTSECIYWKMPMETRQRVYYRKLKSIKKQEDWITINGIFFNAGKSLNLKLIRLLHKLMYVYREA